jgi:transposase InsO family protein
MDTLKKEGIQISMSRKGHCWDNAHMESFFQSLNSRKGDGVNLPQFNGDFY